MNDVQKLQAIENKLSSLRNEIDAMEGTCRALEQEEFYICNPECNGDFESNLDNLLK